MWSTRMSHPPDMANMESYFYQRSVIHLDASAATGDRLMDCIRAAFLLSAFQYMNGRHHSVGPNSLYLASKATDVTGIPPMRSCFSVSRTLVNDRRTYTDDADWQNHVDYIRSHLLSFSPDNQVTPSFDRGHTSSLRRMTL